MAPDPNFCLACSSPPPSGLPEDHDAGIPTLPGSPVTGLRNLGYLSKRGNQNGGGKVIGSFLAELSHTLVWR